MKKLILWLLTGGVVLSYPVFIKVLNSERFDDDRIIPTPILTPTSQQATPTPTATNNTTVVPTSTLTLAPVVSRGKYKDGTYTGSAADAFYGNIQVRVSIASGKISKVDFLQYPNDRGHSIEINQYAMPILSQEAITAQSASVDIVSGATDTSQAFIQSLSNALSQAS